MAAITVTFRDQFGHDVPPADPTCAYVQYDSDTYVFDPYTSTIDAVWDGVPEHYSPFAVGPFPSVAFFSGYRIGATHTPGPLDPIHITMHCGLGDVVLIGGVPAILSVPDPMVTTALLGLSSGYVNITECDLVAHAGLVVGGRGIVINVPDLGRWQVQRAAMRPRSEQSN